MKLRILFLLTVISVFVYAQNFDSYLPVKKYPVGIGTYTTFLNYGGKNHFHQIVALEIGISNADRMVVRGGWGTETRFQLNWLHRIFVSPFIVTLSPGLGALWGTYVDFDAGLTIPFSGGVYLSNQIQVNLYLDVDDGMPLANDTPLWYVLNLHAPLGARSQMHAEFGLPLSSDTMTFFGVGFKLFF